MDVVGIAWNHGLIPNWPDGKWLRHVIQRNLFPSTAILEEVKDIHPRFSLSQIRLEGIIVCIFPPLIWIIHTFTCRMNKINKRKKIKLNIFTLLCSKRHQYIYNLFFFNKSVCCIICLCVDYGVWVEFYPLNHCCCFYDVYFSVWAGASCQYDDNMIVLNIKICGFLYSFAELIEEFFFKSLSFYIYSFDFPSIFISR